MQSPIQVDNAIAWQDAVSETFVDLRCRTVSRDFRAEMATAQLSTDFEISRICSDPLLVERDMIHVQNSAALPDRRDYLLVSIQGSAAGSRVHQYDRTAELAPNSVAVYESDHPYVLDQRDGAQQLLVVKVAKSAVDLPTAVLTDLCAREISAEVPGMAAFMGFITGAASHGGTRELGRIGAELLSVALRSFAGMPETAVDTLDRAELTVTGSRPVPGEDVILLRRAEIFIKDQLHRPELDVSAVARHLNISVSKLYELFAATDTTPALAIRTRRIERAKMLLRATGGCASARTLASIATECGFRDAATFSRIFRREVGQAPSIWRIEHS